MAGEDAGDDGLGQLQPWYPELREAEEEGKVDEYPLQEQPPRGITVLHHLEPVVELPCPEQHVDGECVEALLRRIEEGQGDDGLASDAVRRRVLRGQGQRRRSGRASGRGYGAHGGGRLLHGLAPCGGRWGRWKPRPHARSRAHRIPCFWGRRRRRSIGGGKQLVWCACVARRDGDGDGVRWAMVFSFDGAGAKNSVTLSRQQNAPAGARREPPAARGGRRLKRCDWTRNGALLAQAGQPQR